VGAGGFLSSKAQNTSWMAFRTATMAKRLTISDQQTTKGIDSSNQDAAFTNRNWGIKWQQFGFIILGIDESHINQNPTTSSTIGFCEGNRPLLKALCQVET